MEEYATSVVNGDGKFYRLGMRQFLTSCCCRHEMVKDEEESRQRGMIRKPPRTLNVLLFTDNRH